MTRLLAGFILLPSLLLGLASCHKNDPTIINGMITDAKTGVPIEGAKISAGVWAGSQSVGFIDETTGMDGKFMIEIGDNENFSGLTIQKEGYVPKFRFGAPINVGEANDIIIKMHPRDALLRIVYDNNSNIQESIFLQAQSKTFTEEYGILPYIITQPYPFVCQPLNKDTIDYPFTSDEQINLYWGFFLL